MEYLTQKKGFLGYEANTKIDNKVIVVPFGLEKTVSYGGGTKNGPKEIIKASHQVELYDEDLEKETYKNIGIKTIKPFKIKKDIRLALNQLYKINKEIISKNKFPLVFNGEKFSHASAIKRCLDYKNVKVVSFGIRNISKEEMVFYKNNKDRIEIFWAKDKKNWDLHKLNNLFSKKDVYITFDVDGLDASIMPATGTPEPDGLLWDEVITIIKEVCKISNIVGADINELAPIKNFNSYNFLVAKLAYKILSYTFEFKK